MDTETFEKVIGLLLAIVLIGGLGFLSYPLHSQPEPTKAEILAKLSTDDKRNIAIQFMAEYPSWKYTLCNMPMDGRVK